MMLDEIWRLLSFIFNENRKKDKVYFEGEVNEHMNLRSGESYQLNCEITDNFNKPFKEWINKHKNIVNMNV